MNFRHLAFFLILLSGAQAQDKHSVQPLPPVEQGPVGDVTASGVPSVETKSGAPVVIRSTTKTDTQAAQPVISHPVAVPSPPNDFEQFVNDALGHPLPVFGSHLLKDTGRDFTPPTDVTPSADYIVGSGDQILIRTWGKIDIDVHATVDRNGQIFLPRVGALTVAGLRLDQLTEFVRGAISKQFSGFNLSVSLGELRTMDVYVLGQARAPGVYTISSLSTLVNALFVSGGPGPSGSLRDIQVKRAGTVIAHFDMYRLLLAGDKTQDIRLLPGDIIFIPVLGQQVAIDGNVASPAIYELKPGATTVADLIEEAGGLSAIAGTARAVLEHVIDRSRRTVEDLALNDKGLHIPLQGGDILRIFPISPKITDAVTLRGNVAVPGRYEWRPGMRVADLIPSRETLISRGYYNSLNAQSLGGDKSFSAGGSDAAPGTASHDTEINWNYAAIERLDPADLTTHIVSFNLGDAVDHHDSLENKQLLSGDVVVIYSQKDTALPDELRAKFVRIDGQVKAPGVYRVSEGETLRDLVTRAGGLAPSAYLYASRLTRASVRLEQEAELKTYVEQASEQAFSPSNISSGLTGGIGIAEVEIRKAYIEQLAKIRPDGRVVLQLSPQANEAQDVPEFRLEDGDNFFVPGKPNTVTVIGSVYNQGTLRFLNDAHVSQYLGAAGGVTRDGDRKREFVVRADGSVISRQNTSGLERLKIYPGDALIVPPKFKVGFRVADIIALSQTLATFGVSVLAVRALQ